jgi:excisionase family DNA binding protein
MHEHQVSTYLTVPMVATALGVAPQTVYRLIRRGQLPGVRLGTGAGRGQMFRVRADDLERFVAEREIDSCVAAH